MAQPPPASLAHIPVDASKTEPIAAFYKLQFGDELTGFAYYMRTLVVTIGRNVVPHSNTPPPVITTPNVPSIPPLDPQSHSGGTPSIRNLSLHNAALIADASDIKPESPPVPEVKSEPLDLVSPVETAAAAMESGNLHKSVDLPKVNVQPPGDGHDGKFTNEQALEALAAFATPSPQSEPSLTARATSVNSASVPCSTSPSHIDAGEPKSDQVPAMSTSPSQSHLPLIRDILDGPPPPPPPKSQPPAEPVDVDLGALKSVSRFHAKIEYCADRSQFCLEIHGRNGAWVDGRFFVKGCRVPLEQGSQIQIATRIFSFVLPPSTEGTPNASPVLPQDDYSYPHHLHYHHAAYQDFFGDAGPSTIAARIPPRFNAFANGDFGLGGDGADGGDNAYGWDSEDEEADFEDSDSSNPWASEDEDLASHSKSRNSLKSRIGSGAKGKQKLRQTLFDDDSDLSSLSSEDGDEMDEDHDEEEVRALSSAESSYSERIPTSHRKRDRNPQNDATRLSLGASSGEGDPDGSDTPLVVINGRKDKKSKVSKKKVEGDGKTSHKAGAGKVQITKKTSSPEKHRNKEAAVKTAQSAIMSKSKSKKGKMIKAGHIEAVTTVASPAVDAPEPQHAGKRPKGGKWAAKSVTPALLSDSEGAVKKEDADDGTSANPTAKKDKKDKKKKDKNAKSLDPPAPAALALPVTPSEKPTQTQVADDLPPTLAAAVAIQQASATDPNRAKKKASAPPDVLVRRPSASASVNGSAAVLKTEDHPPAAAPPAPPLTLASVAAAAVKSGPLNHPPHAGPAPIVHQPPPPPVEKPKPPPPPPFQHLTELIDTPGRPGHIIVNVPIPPSGAGPRPPPAPIVGLDGKPFIGPDPQKPTLTFATIIHRALLHLPRGRGTLGEVCNWVAGEWEYFRLNPEAGWQNSIRHNLSLNKAFLKVARIPSDDPESKGSVWIIDPEEGPLFEEKQRRDAEKSEGKMKNAEVKAERERQRAELKAKKAKDKDYIGKDGMPLKPGDPKLRMMAPAGSIPRPNLVRPVGTGVNGAGPILAKGKITVVVQPVTPALRARSSLLSKDANGDLLPFVLDGATLILDQQTFLHLNRDIIEKLEHLGAAGAIEVLSAWVVNRNRQAAAKAAAAAAAANRALPGATGAPANGATAVPKVGSAPLAPRPLGQQAAGTKPGVTAARPAGSTAATTRPPAAGAARPLPGPAAPGETLIKVIGMIAEVAAVRGDVNIVGPNASALLTYIKAVGIDIDMPTAERVWATGVVPPLTGRPPATRPGPIGRTPAPATGTPRQTIGGSSGVVPSANRPPVPLGKYGPVGRPVSTPKPATTPAARPVNGTSVARPPATGLPPKSAPLGGTSVVATSSPKPQTGNLPTPAPTSASSVSPSPIVTSPPVSANPLKRKAEPPLPIDASLSDYSSLIGVGSMPMDEDGGLNGGDAKKARV